MNCRSDCCGQCINAAAADYQVRGLSCSNDMLGPFTEITAERAMYHWFSVALFGPGSLGTYKCTRSQNLTSLIVRLTSAAFLYHFLGRAGMPEHQTLLQKVSERLSESRNTPTSETLVRCLREMEAHFGLDAIAFPWAGGN